MELSTPLIGNKAHQPRNPGKNTLQELQVSCKNCKKLARSLVLQDSCSVSLQVSCRYISYLARLMHVIIILQETCKWLTI